MFFNLIFYFYDLRSDSYFSMILLPLLISSVHIYNFLSYLAHLYLYWYNVSSNKLFCSELLSITCLFLLRISSLLFSYLSSILLLTLYSVIVYSNSTFYFLSLRISFFYSLWSYYRTMFSRSRFFILVIFSLFKLSKFSLFSIKSVFLLLNS